MADWEDILVRILRRVKISHCKKIAVDIIEFDLAGYFVV
jgi:hypothetical protein